MKRRAVISVVALALTLGGCSTFKKLTGQRNDTVLPGEREEILSPDQYTAKNEDLNAPPAGGDAGLPPADATASEPQTADACNPDIDPDCTDVQPQKKVNKGIFDDN